MRSTTSSGKDYRLMLAWHPSRIVFSIAKERRVGMLYPDFEEFIECLNARRVRYLIIGGYAVAFHARPRATKDIDVLVDPTAANAKRVLSALTSFLAILR